MCSFCKQWMTERAFLPLPYLNLWTGRVKMRNIHLSKTSLRWLMLTQVDAMQSRTICVQQRIASKRFGLNYAHTQLTALVKTTIDCTNTRHIYVNIMPYVSYFPCHRPMLKKLSLNTNWTKHHIPFNVRFILNKIWYAFNMSF